mmetsp:Transcript_13972/g.33487  ORF Transcript_13972/g.33487 Transcript_13972/m.33487 type:complete len:209 (+) Transcript_13972:828-1454(+)
MSGGPAVSEEGAPRRAVHDEDGVDLEQLPVDLDAVLDEVVQVDKRGALHVVGDVGEVVAATEERKHGHVRRRIVHRTLQPHEAPHHDSHLCAVLHHPGIDEKLHCERHCFRLNATPQLRILERVKYEGRYLGVYADRVGVVAHRHDVVLERGGQHGASVTRRHLAGRRQRVDTGERLQQRGSRSQHLVVVRSGHAYENHGCEETTSLL